MAKQSNKTGAKGVKAYGSRWIARMGERYLGVFDTREAAAAAYLAAREERDLLAAELRAQFVPLTLRGTTAVIPLTRGLRALIDAADWTLVSGCTWQAHKGMSGVWYAAGRPDGETKVLLHRHLLGLPAGRRVDHWDGNGLNNRRSNLRQATAFQNMGNKRQSRSEGFKGVSPSPRVGGGERYTAVLMVRRRGQYLGTFDTAEEAARAYDAEARRQFGEFACTNFPQGKERPARGPKDVPDAKPKPTD